MNKNLPLPDKCFSLNRYQFLVTVTNAPLKLQGLYFYDSKARFYGLDNNKSIQNIDVFNELVGENDKRYVLLSYSNTKNRLWPLGYSVLNLIPKTDGKSYIHYDLISWNGNTESELCEQWESIDNETGKPLIHNKVINGYEYSIGLPLILNQKTDDVQINFMVTEKNCDTGSIRKYERVFKLSNGIFEEIKSEQNH